ncbi:MAG TPA: dipeptide epimerase [Sphingobacteriaceae bacterium]|nr:dipeptide epimerase [Sphingobacteriaceae bacterium]
MKIDYRPFSLKLKYPFTIAKFSRTDTPLMLIGITYNNVRGLGEASMVPYKGESHETAVSFLNKLDLSHIKYPFDYDEILEYLDSIVPGNPCIKAAIDIALHDLQGKLEQTPCYRFFKSNPDKMPVTSYTIGIDTPEIIIKKVKDGDLCNVLKVKLGRDKDRELIKIIRSVSDKPLYVDANEGWTDRQRALDTINWLSEQGVVLVEQPMPANDPDSNAWITERSPVPIIADEAVQRFADVAKAHGIYSGINIKLMKSAGMYEGYKIIQEARKLGMSILIGCMSETSIATLAAASLAPLCDWADLDGPFLTSNNPYKDPEFRDGRYVLSNEPGLGVRE